jgi:hypothetical protein
MRIARSIAFFLFALAVTGSPSRSSAQISVGFSITTAPPELPVYVQPPIPEYGYIWAPGYWAYGPDGYFWVPGTWVRPPVVGVLWTPGYWGWREGVYVWNEGYWGPHIGYYGGINYGFGYLGRGYEGGRWEGGVFSYNSTVNNFGSVKVVNVYNKTVIENTTVNKVSFNGPGGAAVQPNPQEQAAAREQHTPPTPLQAQHVTAASSNKALLASVNHGAPAVAATTKPGTFTGPGVVASKPATGPATVQGAGGPLKGTDKASTTVGGLPKDTTKEPGNTPAGGALKGTGAAGANPAINTATKRTTDEPGNTSQKDVKATGSTPAGGGPNKGPGAPANGGQVGNPNKGVGNALAANPNPPHPPPAKLAGPQKPQPKQNEKKHPG